MPPSPTIAPPLDPRAGKAWAERYAAMARAMPALARSARTTLLGFSAFVDAYVRLDAAAPLFATDAPDPARALAATLLQRVQAGTGGEVSLGWPEGDDWMAAKLAHRTGAGGTSAQIAKALALLGAPALLALADRSAEQLAVLHPAVQLAEDGTVRRLGDVAPRQDGAKARHWIFEAQEGTEVAGVPVRRSTRVIVRLVDDAPEDDPEFAATSAELSPTCGAAAISSLVSTPDALLPATLERVGAIARGWQAGGLDVVHLELADYGARTGLADRILASLGGAVTSVGMSLSEWHVIAGGAPDPAALRAFGERHGLTRVSVHADDWALTVTRGDPAQEQAALVAGCLLASARAAAGEPVVPSGLPDGASLGPMPAGCGPLGGDWTAVGCPAPYLARPRSTIGLGDTFLAGTLLVLGQPPNTPFDQGELS